MSDTIDFGHYSNVSEDQWRWPSFKPAEMACRSRKATSAGRLVIHKPSMDMLQELRDFIGKPMIVLSAYRTPEHNRDVGGAKRSQHMKGTAFDIRMDNHDPEEFEAAARAVGFTGFGFYRKNNFIHIDTGPAREWGQRWWDSVAEPMFSPEPERAPERLIEDKETLTAGAVGVGAATAAVNSVMASIDDATVTAQAAVQAASGVTDQLRALGGQELVTAVGLAVAVAGAAFLAKRAADRWRS